MKKTPISIVILTKNEEGIIEKCLQSVYGWADEVIVVDDESTDRTVAIAEKYADKVYHRRMDVEGVHRNWAYAQARNEWVFSLDADEYLSEELKQEISMVLSRETDYQAYSMPIRTYIGNYWVKHSGWYPANKIRMFMKSRFSYEEVEVHPRPILNGLEGRLKGDLVHTGYPDFAHFLSSLNRQTTLEAKKWIKTGRRMTRGRAVWRTIDRFPRVFISKRGFKDGLIGFMIALFASLYQVVSYAKYWEMQREK